MQTVLGLSVTATDIKTVLVEGCDADGVTLEHDEFDVFSGADMPATGRVHADPMQPPQLIFARAFAPRTALAAKPLI